MTSPAVKLEDAQAANVPLEQPTVILYSRPPKKRKTRAEQLPEPVTNLPPHKRAKTEAEKDQRKLERVKRNRVAARNSREGKRKEIENYAVELEKARHIISWYESRYGPPPPEHLMLNVRIVRGLPEGMTDKDCKQQIIRGSTAPPTPLALRAQSSFDEPSPSAFDPPLTDATPTPPMEASPLVSSGAPQTPTFPPSSLSGSTHFSAVSQEPDYDDLFKFPFDPAAYDPAMPQDSFDGDVDAFPFVHGAADASISQPLNLCGLFNEPFQAYSSTGGLLPGSGAV